MKMIGVVGGVGCYAGLDLVRKIYDQTAATRDQEYLPVAMLAEPHRIGDRTEFLLGRSDVNPGVAIADVIRRLCKMGASVIGIPCNSAHAPPIFAEIAKRIPAEAELVHMIEEVADHIRSRHPAMRRIGILSTSGTRACNVYPECLSRRGLAGIQVSEAVQEERVQPAIYSPDYGIKAVASPVTARARDDLSAAARHLIEQGAEAIVLGCTEIPLALTEETAHGAPLIDSTKVLARALVLRAAPGALRA